MKRENRASNEENELIPQVEKVMEAKIKQELLTGIGFFAVQSPETHLTRLRVSGASGDKNTPLRARYQVNCTAVSDIGMPSTGKLLTRQEWRNSAHIKAAVGVSASNAETNECTMIQRLLVHCDMAESFRHCGGRHLNTIPVLRPCVQINIRV